MHAQLPRLRHAAAVLTLLLSVAACVSAPLDNTKWAGRDIGNAPYHPLVHHLDLTVLAYQLYSQTVVWPFDPYYELMDDLGPGRDEFMEKVRAWAKSQVDCGRLHAAGVHAYRGPGVLSGFADNRHHDPLVFRYDRLYPWSDAVTNPDGVWVEQRTPREITDRIRDVYVCYRRPCSAPGDVVLCQLPGRRGGPAPDAGDVVLAFEGATGDKGEPGRPPSQSIVGYVLLRETVGDHYDVHIAFRGSRSGSAERAAFLALSTANASGNPDWITDLGFWNILPENGAAPITTTGQVHRGFARSVKSLLPSLFRCLEEVAALRGGQPPDTIHITGHSLGGAHAQHVASALLLGSQYGPGGAGPEMPASLRGWPWRQLKLISFSAPTSGDAEWAETLTTEGLDSEHWRSTFDPVDRQAISISDPSIVARLRDTTRPAGYRVLISKDPITTERIVGGRHVGKTVYVTDPTFWDLLPPPDTEAHQPWKIRDEMVQRIADPRTPPIAWRDRPMEELHPGWDECPQDPREALLGLVAVVKRYYTERGLWFDQAAFERDVALYLRLYDGASEVH